MKRALITGITRQDGSYLAEFLLSRKATKFTASSGAPARLGLGWQKYVKHDARYERPAEVDFLIGDAAKGKEDSRMGTESAIRGAGPHHGGRGHGLTFARDAKKTARETSVRCL